MNRKISALLLHVSCAALLAACAPAPIVTPTLPPAATAPAAASPGTFYDQARAAGRQVLRIDTQHSLIAVTVRRGGALARIGHDHVVASHSIEGQAAPASQGQTGRTDFRFRLDQMTVDEAGLRAQAGLDSVPSADAIAGTRHNMLVKVLDAERYPYVEVRAEGGPDGLLQADITLHGVTRRYAIPAKLAASAAGITANGELTLKQSDFGITPFSVLGGALAVQDQLELRFELSAQPQP
jgi:polyisoprenoid-binding protein YceI